MSLVWITLALVASADPGAVGEAPRFCERPGDCAAAEACVGFVCLGGSARARVEPLYTVAVVPPFVGRGDSELVAVAEAFTAQLREDLAWSGFYRVLDDGALPRGWAAEGASAADLRHAAWQAAGAHRVVKVIVARAPRQAATTVARLRVRAIEVERFGVLDLPQGDVTAAPEQLRDASARWVNALIAADTGIPGAVGTRLAATLEVARGVKEIATIDADGQRFAQVTRNGDLNLGPAWGPGGAGGELGWMSYLSGNADWVVDGRPLSTRPGLNAAGAWSPDGRTLALSVAEAGDSELVLLDAETGAVKAQITDHPAVDTSPTWAPDGARIAFVSDRTGRPQIWIVSLSRGGLEQLTREGYNTSPEWSPLGDSLVFIRQGPGGNFVIMRHDFDTGETRRLTDGRRSAESPTFSPDGRYLAFTQKDSAGSRLWVMTADGDALRPVDPERAFFSPEWRR